MHNLSRCLLVGFALAAATASSFAGIKMIEVNTSPAGNVRSEMLLDGERFKISYVEAPMGMPPGMYMLGTGPDKMYMVVPSRTAYARFDPGEFGNMAQKQGGGAGGPGQMPEGMKMTVEDFVMKKELDEAGPAMLGLSTRHYRYTVSYKSVMSMPGMPQPMTTTVSENHEFWSTTDLAEAASISAWQAKAPASTGMASVDKTVEAARTMAKHGVVLKSVVTSKSVMGGMGGMGALGRMMGGGGGSDTTTMKKEVVAFSREDLPASAFVLPKDYRETDMMNLFMGRDGGAPDKKGKPRSAMPDLK